MVCAFPTFVPLSLSSNCLDCDTCGIKHDIERLFEDVAVLFLKVDLLQMI